jgi:serine protease Do
MTGFRRWSLAVICLGLGLAGGFVSHAQMAGQPPAAVPPPMPRDAGSFSPVVKRVLPAVISIEVKARTGGKPDAPGDDSGFGSGVLIDPSGVVLTNYHVVQDATEAEVTLADGRKFITRDVRRDPKSDLAILKVATQEPLPFLEFADSDAMEVGDHVLAVGAPFGLTGSVTHGIVSAKSRNNLKLNQFEDFIQTDAAVNPGSSGGPLVNLEGKVVGITAAIKTRNGGFTGVGLAVASNLCKVVTAQLLKEGVVRRGQIGVLVRDLDPELARKLGVKPNSGAVITRVEENGPAAKAGLSVGDVITAIGGQPVKDSRDVQRVVAGLPLNQVVEVVIIRDGKVMLAKLTVEQLVDGPAPAPALPPQPQAGVIGFQNLGLGVADLTPELVNRLGYPPNTKGALVAVVTRNGPAEQAGLRAGQVIVKVDKTPVANAAAFQQAIGQADKDKGALLQVLRPSGEVDFVVLKLN